ncbi:TPA: hypothetical protein IAC10_04040 [Candidatus Scatousia excrementigallinarum]|uniref:Uncharacterized protein n=1 Tax=Candidatus Scatousia excrementigallinarum TaxID=2840935 RepID=A0A9D1EY21_9BACT|nr:hypothetical protein [Candidatus Scatousia excrementigallinarum]
MKKELVKSIKEKEEQLEKLKEHVDKSVICSELYNKVVLEKAILKKQLDDLERNKLAEKVRYLFPRKKTRICDYFRK